MSFRLLRVPSSNGRALRMGLIAAVTVVWIYDAVSVVLMLR